jgi:hypothetical protein
MLHDITHHSPSSLNLFAASNAMYVLERILGRKQPVGAPAHRGKAVEDGVTYALEESATMQQSIDVALTRYDSLTALSGDPRSDSYRRDIPEMVAQAVGMLAQYGEPSTTQGFVEWRPDGLQLPVIGYYDYAWEDKGLIIDLKTSERMPSEIKNSHARQVSLYCAGNMEGRLVYCTPKKIQAFHLENIREHRDTLCRLAFAVEKFLSLSDDPQFYVSITAPDLDSYYWASPEARQTAWEVWRI